MTGPRWTALRRRTILLDLRSGRITHEGVKNLHGIDQAELSLWEASYALNGLYGLSANALTGFARNLRAGALA
jgi:hypothetical protein